MARKDDIYSLANNYTAFELARMIMDKQDIIDGMSETLKTYREKTNQAAELINMATEKKHGEIRTGKYVNRKNGVEVELVKVFESGTCVIKHNEGGSQISKEEFESKFVKQHDDQADALRYQQERAVCMDWKKYQELKGKAELFDAIKWNSQKGEIEKNFERAAKVTLEKYRAWIKDMERDKDGR